MWKGTMIMNDNLNQLFAENKRAEEYFSSLPVHIQEMMKQTGVNLTSEQDLRNCAETLMKTK